MSLEADVRVEVALPNRVQLPGGKRRVPPLIATFLHGKADHGESAGRTCIGFDDRRIGKLPWG